MLMYRGGGYDRGGGYERREYQAVPNYVSFSSSSLTGRQEAQYGRSNERPHGNGSVRGPTDRAYSNNSSERPVPIQLTSHRSDNYPETRALQRSNRPPNPGSAPVNPRSAPVQVRSVFCFNKSLFDQRIAAHATFGCDATLENVRMTEVCFEPGQFVRMSCILAFGEPVVF